MKKFERLPPEKRKEEICAAALQLFREKGFSATTMENIVEKVTLSKGGVYRLYPSTDAILSDLMLQGMHLRNIFYEQRVQEAISAGRALTMEFLVDMIADSLLLYPEFSSVYVEFLWEKQRNPRLEQLYRTICAASLEETTALIQQYGAEDLLLTDGTILGKLTELMNAAVLSMQVLQLRDVFTDSKKQICEVILGILNPMNK